MAVTRGSWYCYPVPYHQMFQCSKSRKYYVHRKAIIQNLARRMMEGEGTENGAFIHCSAVFTVR